jgi:hypothetical protein
MGINAPMFSFFDKDFGSSGNLGGTNLSHRFFNGALGICSWVGKEQLIYLLKTIQKIYIYLLKKLPSLALYSLMALLYYYYYYYYYYYIGIMLVKIERFKH